LPSSEGWARLTVATRRTAETANAAWRTITLRLTEGAVGTAFTIAGRSVAKGLAEGTALASAKAALRALAIARWTRWAVLSESRRCR
jgi:hypothetical protein